MRLCFSHSQDTEALRMRNTEGATYSDGAKFKGDKHAFQMRHLT